MAESPQRSDKRSFLGLIVSQALSSFNDNFFKAFLIFYLMDGAEAGSEVRLALYTTVLFIAPFILFSSYAGWLADAFSKSRVIVWLKGLEIALMGVGVAGFIYQSNTILFGVLVLMAVQSALFSPAKYGILPEILETRDLARGNGILELTNFAAIILGTSVGAVGYPDAQVGAYVIMGVALLSYVAALTIRKLPAAARDRPLRLNPLPELRTGLGVIFPERTLRLTVLGVVYFWSLALLLDMNLLFYGKWLLNLETRDIGILRAVVGIGIGTGSALAGILSRRKPELGLVPIGSLGMAAFSILLCWTHRLEGAFWWTLADLALLGLSGGFFIVPLNTLLQQEAPADKKGNVIATANTFTFASMLLTLGLLWFFLGPLGFTPAQAFFAAGLATIAGTVYVLTLLPQQMFRLVLWVLTNTIYRVRLVGAENVPLRGPALLVANHVSFVDGLLILASTHRSIRFLVYTGITRVPGLRALSRVMRVIPISAEEGPRSVIGALKEAARSLEAGELVCIFAEGQISRTGQLLPFRGGAERILKNFPAPVIPVHLDRVWGSIFSFAGGRFFWKLPRRLPYPVTVSFGKPMPPDVSMVEVRDAVQELGSGAAELRKQEQRPLPWRFMRHARRHPFAQAMVDSSGRQATFGKLAASVVHLSRILREVLRDEEAAGLLLPPSVAGAAVNAAASLLGKPVVNLNYTASAEAIRSAMEQTKIRTVISSRAFLEKVRVVVPGKVIHLEDLAGRHGRLVKLLDALAAWTLPQFLLRRWIGGKSIGMDDIVTIIFSSGSTGEPKGVLLSHFNVISNIQSVTQVLSLGPKDRILGVLPFFHATGYTGGLWAPLLMGMAAVYHPNPLDARTVGEMVRKHGVTILFATPTFIQGYARRCEREDFGSLQYAIVGAEKLTAAVSELFQQRFGVEPMEGYGCTEASPMIAVNIPDFRGRGIFQVGGKRGSVGHPLPGVSVKIIDPETGERLQPGKPGMLLVKGPNVMQGYLEKPELTAEVLRDGWYQTGDIAVVDEDGFITITDRLSRFSKIAGEMVPHLKIEEALNGALGLDEPAFFVTSVADERKGERLAVVHTASDEQLRDLFEKLPAQGLPNLWTPRADSFVRVDEIPRLGTGKVALRKLRQIAEQALVGQAQAAC